MTSIEIRDKYIAKLEYTNKRISDECHKLVDSLEKKQNRIAELEAQIEKMKCCGNCKHSDTECEGYTICGIGHYDDCLSNKVFYHTTDEKDYWELEEND